MKCRAIKGERRGGLLLIECVIYLTIFVVLFGLALACFYVAWEHHRDLARNARSILNTTQVGELWREEVRRADGTIQVNAEGLSMEVPRGQSSVVYRLAEDKILRTEGTNASVVLLESVRSSRLVKVEGKHARAWRWELELAAPQKAARVVPLFVFTAVSRTP